MNPEKFTLDEKIHYHVFKQVPIRGENGIEWLPNASQKELWVEPKPTLPYSSNEYCMLNLLEHLKERHGIFLSESLGPLGVATLGLQMVRDIEIKANQSGLES